MTESIKKNKNRSIIAWIFGCFGVFVLVISLVFNLVLTVALFASMTDVDSSYPHYNEIVVEGSDYSEDKIAVIHVDGVILHGGMDGDLFSDSAPSAEVYAEQIRQAAHDDSVKALILSINSPGGSVSASDLVYHEILKYLDTGKPLIAHYGEIAASGAMYLSLPANVIVTEPTSLVGSIGTIMTNINYEGLFDKIGLREDVFKSGEYKDIFSSTREMTDEEKKIINELIQHDNNRFKDIVIAHRPEIKESDYGTIFDARIFSSTDAKEIGLVDSIGYFEDAKKEAELLSGVQDYALVEYEVPFTFSSLFKGFAMSLHANQVAEMSKMLLNNHPRSMFLWK